MFIFIKSAFQLYKINFWQVLLIGVTVILPIQIVYSIAVNFISLPFFYFGIPLWPSIFQGLFMLISLFLMQLPLISMAKQDIHYDDIKLSKTYGETIRHGFFAYVTSFPYAVIVVIGLLFFVVPGLIVLILFMGIPYVKVIEERSIGVVLKKSFQFGKENFFNLLGYLLLFAAVDIGLSYFISSLMIFYSNQFAALNWVLMLVNMFLFPVFVFSVVYLYENWKNKWE